MANSKRSLLIPYVVLLLLLSFGSILGAFFPGALAQEKYNPSEFIIAGKNPVANRLLLTSFLALSKNNMHKGLEHAESAIKLDPSLGQAYLIKGVCLYELDHPHEAIDALKKGLSLLPDKGKAVLARSPSEPAYSRHVLATALAVDGRSAESLAVLKEADAMFPKSCAIGADLGDYYRSRNQDELAIKHYTNSIASGFGSARESRANLYLAAGKCALALADVNALIQKDPDNSRIYMLRSRIYKKMGNMPLAEKDIIKANSRSLDQF